MNNSDCTIPKAIVVDTSVMVAALFRSRSKAILDLWRKGELRLCYSPAVLDEYQWILKKIPPIRTASHALIHELKTSTHTVVCLHPASVKVNIQDPADRKFIECAVAADADCIVSLDAHLLDIGRYNTIPIVRPLEFLCRWNRNSRP